MGESALGTYTFRLRFTVSHAPAFLFDGEALELDLPGHNRVTTLRPLDGPTVREAKEFTLDSGGFPSEGTAREIGERARRALRLAFVDMRIGFNLEDRPSTLSLGRVVLERAREQGIELRGDPHGLTVYPEGLGIQFFSMRANAVVSSPLEKVIASFSRSYEQDPSSANRVSLGLELYGLSYFESSARARFVTLITAIESSVEQHSRPEEARALLQRFICEARGSKLSRDEQTTLVAGLGNLKRESIATACSRFVAAHGTSEDVKVWKQSHRCRHAMVHQGRTPDDLRRLLPQLDDVVRRALLNCAYGETSSDSQQAEGGLEDSVDRSDSGSGRG